MAGGYKKVNLDAMIRREDFLVEVEAPGENPVNNVAITGLEPGNMFYQCLRKPDFQRETCDWDSKKVVDCVASFVSGDLIPAIILWSSGPHTFVIDGAHRLSALIAWVTDDYGDGERSRKFFGRTLSGSQVRMADKTRKAVEREVGKYQVLKEALANPGEVDRDLLERAGRLNRRSLVLQWVPGNAGKAEDSFFKINQKAVPINPTEFRLLKARRKPNALCARAMWRPTGGHQYWAGFQPELREKIQRSAGELADLLFEPELQAQVQTEDLPIAGNRSSALPLVFDLVNVANDVRDDDELLDDTTGEQVITFLEKTRALAGRIAGRRSGSLGLHPLVYFYSSSGRYQPTALLGMFEAVKKMEADGSWRKFINARRRVESFILRNKSLVNQVTISYGSRTKGSRHVSSLFQVIIEGADQGLSEAQILKVIVGMEEFRKLSKERPRSRKSGGEFSQATKQEIFIREKVSRALKCEICEGLLPASSIATDHLERKSQMGTNGPENGMPSHPYCNSVIKQ